MAKLRYHIFFLFLLVLGNAMAQQSIDGGYYHTVFLCSDSSVWASGTNFTNELGIDTNSLPIPAKVDGLENIISLASGGNHTLALNDQGQVFAWGSNQNNQLGDSSLTSSAAPVQLPLNNIIAISTGESFSFAIRNDGSVYAWGKNNAGQLGLGHNQAVNEPELATNWGMIKSIAGGQNHAVAVRADGSVWTSGINNQYQLGDGTTLPTNTPVQVGGINNAIKAAAGFYHSCIVDQSGLIWSWGYNEFGSLGDGSNTTNSTPVPVAGVSNAIDVDAGQYHTIALTDNGEVLSWGINYYGQLGNGTYADKNVPASITSMGVNQVYAGIYHSGQVTTMETKSWGLNSNYQLGNGTNSNSASPVTTILGCSVQQMEQVCFTEANFTPSTITVCEGEEISFTNASQNSFDYDWKIDGVSQFQGLDFVATFNNPGTYEVKLIANPNGCADTATIAVTVDELPEATIYTQGSLCAGEDSVELIAVGSIGSWSGTGVSGSNFNPSVAGQGTHELIYTMTNGTCSNRDTLSVQVGTTPISSFNYTSIGDTIQFSNSSVGATSFEWFFGDGETSTEPNPQHVFKEGVHNVVLLANNYCGTEVFQQQVVIENGSLGVLAETEVAPTLDIYPNPTKGKAVAIVGGVGENTTITITDMSGRKVLEVLTTRDQKTYPIDLSEFSQGVYLVKMPIANRVLISKIVVE